MGLKALPLAFLLLAVAARGFSAPDSTPVPPAGTVEVQGRSQLVVTLDNVDILAEVLGRSEYANPQPGFFGAVTLGGYYRVLKNLKLGAFYRVQDGAHHDDDWSNPGPGWSWQDTTGRFEQLLMLDASPRFLLDFLPGRDWVFMLKTRYIYNASYENQQSIMARPELTWFWIQDRVPLLNVSMSYELYFPLNFGSTFVYEGYPYLSLLWHATPEVALELGGAYKSTVWSTSAAAKTRAEPSYQVTFNTWVVSLGVVFTLAY
jgi:hypothetical protein